MRNTSYTKPNIVNTSDIKHAVIYARYSSSSQTEQSIDGQLRVCNEYAERLGYKVINEYVDRAKTGTNTNRPAFQNMIADSEKGQFQAVIVYMVDRFARSKEDSVIYKAQLRRNGVKVLSASEQISDSDEGYLIEGLLEMFAEQYSTKLSKRVKLGLQESVRNGNFTGGIILYGYKVENKKVVIDKEKAPIIRYAFEQYAKGVPKKVIVNDLNTQGHRTNRGGKFTINSFQNTLSNKKYIGETYFNGVLLDEGYPQIIDNALFDKVQNKLAQNKRTPAATGETVNFMLYGKAYCGNCGSNMVGVSGTGKVGTRHYYYACSTRYKLKTCDKKYEGKIRLEDWIIENVQKYILSKESAELIADRVLEEYARFINTGSVNELQKRIKSIDKKLDNIVEIMMAGTKNPDIINKLDEKANDLTLEREVVEAELSKMMLAVNLPHTKEDIIKYFEMFSQGSYLDKDYQMRIIDRIINSIFIYDDKILIYFNVLNDKHVSFDMIPDLLDMEKNDKKKYDPSITAGVRISCDLAES